MVPDLKALLDRIDVPADWLGIRVVKESANYRSVRDGHPQVNGRSLNNGVMVEAMVNGQIGYGATNGLDLNSIQRAATAAYGQALAASQWAIHPMTPAVRPKVVGNYTSPFEKNVDALTTADISEVLVRLCDTMKVSDRIVQTNATALNNVVETWFVSSNGSDVYQKFVFLQTHFGVTAQDGAVVQTRSHNGGRAHCYQGSWELFPSPDMWAAAKRVGDEAVELLTADDCPTEATTLVLAPDQMMLQIHESVGHPLELDRILGDERNYAGGSFVTPKDFGTLSYGSPLMNITFDPTVNGEFASYGFDDTGAVATKEYLIKEGVLQRGLGSLESQARLKVDGVACARATSWNRPPIDRMANINLEPGTESVDDMISGIERGVYMEANRSWSIDDQRHKFQFGCEYGKLIEHGKLTKTVKNPNYRATTPQFWHSLTHVGNGASWRMYGTPFCGKGEPNQIIRVGHGSPVCVFDNIEVFGGVA
jgi:predicted Zn-dependent protease